MEQIILFSRKQPLAYVKSKRTNMRELSYNTWHNLHKCTKQKCLNNQWEICFLIVYISLWRCSYTSKNCFTLPFSLPSKLFDIKPAKSECEHHSLFWKEQNCISNRCDCFLRKITKKYVIYIKLPSLVQLLSLRYQAWRNSREHKYCVLSLLQGCICFWSR